MPDKQLKKGRGGWLFLALTLLAYMLLGLINPEVTVQALTFFIHVITQVLPMLGLVFLLLCSVAFFQSDLFMLGIPC